MAAKIVRVGQHEYQIQLLNALDQYHVARRGAMMLLGIAGMQDPTPENGGKMIVAMSARLPQEDADFAMSKCLGACHRKEQAGWAPVMVNGSLMFQDMSLPEMAQLYYHALLANGIISFFVESPSASETAPPKA